MSPVLRRSRSRRRSASFSFAVRRPQWSRHSHTQRTSGRNGCDRYRGHPATEHETLTLGPAVRAMATILWRMTARLFGDGRWTLDATAKVAAPLHPAMGSASPPRTAGTRPKRPQVFRTRDAHCASDAEAAPRNAADISAGAREQSSRFSAPFQDMRGERPRYERGTGPGDPDDAPPPTRASRRRAARRRRSASTCPA